GREPSSSRGVTGTGPAGPREALPLLRETCTELLRGGVRVKAMKTGARRSIQYLLSADRKLRRLSLKRIPKRARTTKGPHRATRSHATARSRKAAPAPVTNTAIVLTVAVIIGAVALIALPSLKYDTPSADAAAASSPIDTIVTPRGIMPNTLVTPAAPG